MTPAPRASTATVVLAMLAFGALLVTVGLAVIVSLPARAAVAELDAPDAGIVITPVSTVVHASPLIPPLPPSLSVQSPSDLSAGVPIAVQSALPLPIPDPLVDPNLSLFTGPVAVPLEIQIPALQISAPVMGVGLTLTNAMSSPRGIRPNDPLWQTVFWYRGGTIPGDIGTATFAGHYDDVLGRPAIFAYLGELLVGDLIVVHDQRNGLEIPFIVTETETYTEQEAADPAVLARIFGSASVSSAEAQSTTDQLSHLTLITCGGTWVNGSFNLRLVVYAIRASYPI